VADETKQVDGERAIDSDTARSQPKKRMSEGELLALIASYERASLGSQIAAGATISTTIFPSNQAMTTLEIDRYNAINAYFARPLGNEIENRSQIVLPELRDTIEWIMPQLMRMFVGAKTVCRFDPENELDEKQAELETMAVNHVFMQQNDGVMVLHDFFKDALLMRNGYVEVYTKEETKVSEESYTGLTEIEVAEILNDAADEEIEVIGQREYLRDVMVPIPQLPMAIAGQPQNPQAAQVAQHLVVQTPAFDIRIRRKAKQKRVCVACLPPEEMRISARARNNMEDVSFAMHITNVARSDLITDGYERDWVNSLASGRPNWLEIDALARNQVVDQLSIENPSDFAMQEIELRKVIMRVDYDGDGVAELRRIVVGGDKIGENEVIEETPFASCTPKRMPHRHTGISLYDEIMDLQIIKTTLFRQGLDNLTIANNQRIAVDWRNVNMDDLLTSRPGGVVRGSGPPSTWMAPIQSPSNIVEQVLPVLGYIDELRTARTGVGEHTTGLDPDDLQNMTKGGQMAAMSAATLKIELVARLLAEGVKDIFRKIHSELIRNQDKPLELEISGKWVQIDPTSWRRRTKVSPNVGLGSGNREELRSNVIVLSQMQAPLAQMGMVGPKQAFNTFKVGVEALGFSNPEQFAMDPNGQEFAQHMKQMQAQAAHQPQAPQVQAAQIRAGMEQSKQASEDQRKILELLGQLNQAKDQAAEERLKAMTQLNHEAVQGHKDREVQLDSTHSDMVQTLIKAFSSILASQLKGDPSADAGQAMAKDVNEADQGIEGGGEKPPDNNDRLASVLEALTQHMSRPRTATLSDGRTITIQ